MVQPSSHPNFNEFQYDPVEDCLTRVLFLGRIIGVVPYTFKFKPKIHAKFRWICFSTFHTVLLLFVSLVIPVTQLPTVLQNIGEFPTVLEELKNLEDSSYRISVVFVYLYFLRNARKLLDLLGNWSKTSQKLGFHSVDRGFPKFCIVITILVLGIGITENILCDICTFDMQDERTVMTQLVKINGPQFATLLPANINISVSIFLLYAMKITTYSWNFGDIFLIVVCRAISYKFTQVNEQIEYYIRDRENNEKEVTAKKSSNLHADSLQINDDNRVSEKVTFRNEKEKDCQNRMVEGRKGEIIKHVLQQMKIIKHNKHSNQTLRNNISSWTEAREKILILCKLSQDWTCCVVPLVLNCYGCNMYLIVQRVLAKQSQVFRLLYNSKSEYDTSVYAYVSAMQFTMRVILVTYYASQVYHSTEAIVATLERSSDSTFSETACRLERLLTRHPVGVTIFGAFQITRKFFISIISFLFTTEIVLLQTMSAKQGKFDVLRAMNESDATEQTPST